MIKIAHLYYDLMNLYGENGNIKALLNHFEKQNIKCEVHFLTADDKINFDAYDIYYIGMGTEESQLIALKDLLKYKINIKKAINEGKTFIATGNSYELFGNKIEKLNGDIIPALEVFDYYAKEIDFRISEEELFSTSLISKKIIGFQNRSSIIKNEDNHLFDVTLGTGYEPESKIEGYHFNNFYGSYLIGPLLIRNPYFTDYIVKKICKENKLKYNENYTSIDYKAYNEFIKNIKEAD